MPDVSAWLTLTVAVVGVAGTFSGTAYTQRRADRRERERWDRDVEERREQWSRDDVLRTEERDQAARDRVAGDRRAAYLAFLTAVDRCLEAHDIESRPDLHHEIWVRYEEVRLYGSKAAAGAAREALDGATEHVFRDLDWEVARGGRDRFLEQIRRDLEVPD